MKKLYFNCKKIKRSQKQTEYVSVVFSRSCTSTLSNVARALKMRIPKINSKYDNYFPNWPGLTKIEKVLFATNSF